MCIHFMIWWLHINLTVYHQYPTIAILAHKHFYLSLEDISQREHAHREAIVSEFTKSSNNRRNVLDSGGKPYSVVSHV